MTTKPIVSSTMRIFGTQFEKNEDQAPRVYRIEKSFATVHFDVGAKGQIVFLPEGSELCIVGASRLAGCFEVLCGEQLYNIFKVDLKGPWSTLIRPVPIQPAPSKPVSIKAVPIEPSQAFPPIGVCA
jgi:hypothetical protein